MSSNDSPLEFDGGVGDAAAIINAMERYAGADEVYLDEVDADGEAVLRPKIAIVPANQQIVSLKKYVDEYRSAPERVTGTARLDTLDSFIAHVQRFKRPFSAVFAGPQSLTAVYDYHDQTTPAFCQHRAVYKFPWSDEWEAWTSIDDRPAPQLAFAQFLEDHVTDITVAADEDSKKYFGDLGFTLASPAQMLAISRGLAVRVDAEAVAKNNLSTGELEVSYKEEHSDAAGQPLKIPGGFLLLIPAFKQGVRYKIPVRLRYRVSSGKVHWTIKMYRREAVVQDAIRDACATVIDKTQAPLFYGEPESSRA